MSQFSPQAYGPAIAGLLAERLNELGPGEPNRGARVALAALSPERLVAPHALADREMAAACLAGLWLYHDFADESHALSQEIETVEGSYWHGILHRREPDFSNAKYWFRRVGSHPISSELAAATRDLAQAAESDRAAEFLGTQAEWDHFRFVDLCQAVLAGRSSAGSLCRQVQLCEWRLLFAHCYRCACVDSGMG
jgi:hypothetical protein